MSALRNMVTLIGRVSKDIELRKTQSDIPVCNFSIAVQRPGANKEDKPDFFDCVAWRGTAENISKFFGQGDGIGIIGSLQNDEYQDKDGNNRRKTVVKVDSFEFLPGKKQRNEQSEPAQQDTIPEPIPVNTDEMPF